MNYRFSYLAILITLLSCLAIDFNLKLWEKQDRVIEHDVHHYYGYLPLKFIYDDIKMEKSNYQFSENYFLVWPVFTKDGRKTLKSTMGVSILISPFFFVAHQTSRWLDYPQSGFSEIYKLFLQLSAIFYLYIGLYFIFKSLKQFKFSDAVIATTLLMIGLGTNLLCYSSQSATMSHVYSFGLIAMFMYYTIKWHEKSTIIRTIILGILLGLLTLIRPTNVSVLIFFILYNVNSLTSLKVNLHKITFKQLLLAILTILLIWTPQLIYWKITTGHYLYYSYGEEKFFFTKPKIIHGLFSFTKGWLIYTPILIFSFIGIAFLRGELKKIRLTILLFWAVNIYLAFSWWCWWYGGSYGQRSLIDYYAFAAIPMASFIQYIFDKKIVYKIATGVITIFFIWLNIFQTYQFERGSLHYDGMTRKLYFKQFGKMKQVDDFYNYVSQPNREAALKGELIYNKNN